MKPFIKVGSLLLAVLMLCTAFFAAGCTPASLNKEWSYRNGDNELAIGVYIYSLSVAYSKAESFAKDQLGDDYNSASSDWLDKEIKDDDDNKKIAREWIKDEANKMCLAYLAVDEQIKAEGIDVGGATADNANEQAETYWNVGPYASQGYVMPMKDDYENFGVSLESFAYCTTLYNTKYQAIFDKIYNEGGSKYVSDDELTKYFKENYTDYKYLPVNLYTASTDEAGEQNNIAMSDKEIDKIKKELEGYAKDINNGKSYDDVISAYMNANNVESDPSQSGVEILDDSSVGDEIKKAIEKLKTNKASTLKVGDGDSAIYYLVFKGDISKDVDDYIKNDLQRPSVLANMKTDEFKDYIDDLGKALKAEQNTAVLDKYQPELFFVAVEPTTAAAEDSADE